MIAIADAHEAAERHHRVRDLAGDLVDHDAVDRAKLLSLPIVNRCALHLVCGDQGVWVSSVI
jgi:hypothetical protein